MKTILKDLFAGLFLSVLLAVALFEKNEFKISALIVSLAFFLCLFAISRITNTLLSFVVLTAVGVVVAYYDIEYIMFYYPYTVFVWTAKCSKKENVTPLYFFFTVVSLFAATYFCIQDKTALVSKSNYLIMINKFVLVPIVIVLFIVYQYYKQTRYCGEQDEQTSVSNNVALMTISYLCSILFLINAALRHADTVSTLTPWICAMIYVYLLDETMLFTSIPVLNNLKTKQKEEQDKTDKT